MVREHSPTAVLTKYPARMEALAGLDSWMDAKIYEMRRKQAIAAENPEPAAENSLNKPKKSPTA
jgi:hypothetical protein